MEELKQISLRKAMVIMLAGTIVGAIVGGGFSTLTSLIGCGVGAFFMAVLSAHSIKDVKIATVTIIVFAIGYLFTVLGAAQNISHDGFETIVLKKWWNSFTSSEDPTLMVTYLRETMSGRWFYQILSSICIILSLSVTLFFGSTRCRIISLLFLISQAITLYLHMRLYNNNITDSEYESINMWTAIAQGLCIVYTLIVGDR